MAWTIGRYSRPRLGRLAAWRSGWASSTRESAGCAAPGRSPSHSVDPAAAVLLHVATGMLHAGRGQHQSALEAFAAAARAQSLAHRCARSRAADRRMARGHAGSPRDAEMRRARRSPDSPPSPRKSVLIYAGQMGAIYNARAVICLAEGDPAGALDALRGVLDTTPPVVPGVHSSLNRICSPASRTCAWGIEPPPPRQPRQRSRPPSQTG